MKRFGDRQEGDVSNVINLPVSTNLDLDPERVLDAAKDANLKGVVILGWDENDEEYMASSIADGGDVNWLLDRLKFRLISKVEL